MWYKVSNLRNIRARLVQEMSEQQTTVEQGGHREPAPGRQPSPERRVEPGPLPDPHTTSNGDIQPRLESWLSAVLFDVSGYVPTPRSSKSGSLDSSSEGTRDPSGRDVEHSPYRNNSPSGVLQQPQTDDARDQTPAADDAAPDPTVWEEISLGSSEFETIDLDSEDCMTTPVPPSPSSSLQHPPPAARAFAATRDAVMRVGQGLATLGRSGLGSCFGAATTED